MAAAQILRSKPPGSRIIIFCSTKRMCDQLSMQLSREFRAAAIHGDKRQQERDHVIASFKDGRMPIMCAMRLQRRGRTLSVALLVVLCMWSALHAVLRARE